MVLTTCKQVTDAFDNGHEGVVYPMKFKCHAIVDKGHIIKWLILGCDRRYQGGFLGALKDRVRLEFPDAEFEAGEDLPWGSIRV